MTQEEKKPAGKALRARILKQSKKPLLILCIILAALYCCYQLYQWRVPSVKTEVAMEQSVYNAVDAEVFVVRDEYILSNTASGKVIPLVEDGKRVAKGDVVAMVFRNDEEAANYLRVRELDSQISHYQQLAKHLSSASDINALNEEAFSILLDSLDTAGSGQFSKFGDRMEELGDLMTRRQMTMGEEIDFESMISALQAERSGISLDESAYTKITAERSGYYISSTDGLEGVLPLGKIASVTQDMLQKWRWKQRHSRPAAVWARWWIVSIGICSVRSMKSRPCILSRETALWCACLSARRENSKPRWSISPRAKMEKTWLPSSVT